MTLGGVVLPRENATDTGFRLTLPAGDPGPVELTVTDVFGRVQSVPDVVRRISAQESGATSS